VLLALIAASIGLASCAAPTAGERILDDLRRQQLITDESGAWQPVASMSPAAHQPSEAGALAGDEPLSLAMLLNAADRLNPRLAAARSAIGAAGGRAFNAALYPNPTLGVESENIRFSGGGFGASETTVNIVQPIIISDRRRAAVAAGRSRMSTAELELVETRRNVHGAVRREAMEIVNIRESIALHHELIELADRTRTIARTRFEARAAPESEAIRAEVESNTLSLSIDRLEGELAAAEARLAALLGGHAVHAQQLDASTIRSGTRWADADLDTLKQRVRTTHPSVLVAQERIETAQRQVDLERERTYPDINARFGLGINHADDEPFVEAGVGIPLPILDDNRGAVLAARFDVIRARRLAEAQEEDLVSAVAEAFHRWASARRRLDAYEQQILSGAQRAFDQTRGGYRAGKLPFLDLLDAQRTLMQASIARIELVRAVDAARAELHAILGNDLFDMNTGDTEP